MSDDTRFCVGLDHIKGLGFGSHAKLRAGFPTMADAWNASAGDLEAAGLSKKQADSVVKQRSGIDLDGLMAGLERAGIQAFPFGSGAYPSQLRDIENPPGVLYVRGKLLARDLHGVTVVGTRDCTPYGKAMSREFAGALASRGVTVVSDMVRGIDYIANASAIDAGGRTVAVSANGLDRFARYGRGRLVDRIMREDAGCLVSEHPIGGRSYRGQMRLRNRLLSGLSKGLLVVEAPKQSGTMLTVRCALDQGREVFALPGRANSPQSEGTNWLISQGAKVVTEVDDIINELDVDGSDDLGNNRLADSWSEGSMGSMLEDRGPDDRLDANGSVAAGRGVRKTVVVIESESERRIVDALDAGGGVMSVDEIARETNLPVDKTGASLSIMEIRGCVLKSGTGYRLPPSVQHTMAPMLIGSE